MKRLTYGLGNDNRTYGLVDKASAKPGLFTDYDGFYANLLAHHRLGQYEDILFDADGKELVTVEHLTELVKAEQKRREGCEYCNDASFRQHGEYVDGEGEVMGVNNCCINCGRDLRGESHDGD